MKTAILAGGRGTRLGSVTRRMPKPMVEIGGQPILWHLMHHYVAFGMRDFVVALGYLGECIRAWAERDIGSIDCNVDLVDTGLDTATGGRIKRLAPHIGTETFMLTWGDGLSDVDLSNLLAFHRSHGRLATVTAVQPPSRFGQLTLNCDQVVGFQEKPKKSSVWINGAFFVLEPAVFDYIAGDDTAWEREPMERLAADGQLMAWRHEGFWQCMDTIEERDSLERLWSTGQAPWLHDSQLATAAQHRELATC